MPAVVLLLFFLLPSAVAISADLSHFLLLTVLGCVVAGLTMSTSKNLIVAEANENLGDISAERRRPR